MTDILGLMKKCKSINNKKVIQRMRGKFKTNCCEISKDDFIDDLCLYFEKSNSKFKKEDIKNFMETLEEFFLAYANEALKNKLSYKFSFLDDYFCVDYYDSRKVRNPAENKEFMSEPKVQFKFLNKRKDRESLEHVSLYD